MAAGSGGKRTLSPSGGVQGSLATVPACIPRLGERPFSAVTCCLPSRLPPRAPVTDRLSRGPHRQSLGSSTCQLFHGEDTAILSLHRWWVSRLNPQLHPSLPLPCQSRWPALPSLPTRSLMPLFERLRPEGAHRPPTPGKRVVWKSQRPLCVLFSLPHCGGLVLRASVAFHNHISANYLRTQVP